VSADDVASSDQDALGKPAAQFAPGFERPHVAADKEAPDYTHGDGLRATRSVTNRDRGQGPSQTHREAVEGNELDANVGLAEVEAVQARQVERQEDEARGGAVLRLQAAKVSDLARRGMRMDPLE